MAFAGQNRPFDHLERGKAPSIAAKAVADSGLSPLVKGALYLYLDCFEEAHNIANEREGAWEGNWLHAILHRREPDAGNAKYWYARVQAPEGAYRAIGWAAMEILGNKPPKGLEKLAEKVKKSCLWEPELFVEACDKVRQGPPNSPEYQMLVRLQEIEWRNLLEAFLKATPS
jgi:hypothetical protein